MLITTEIYSSSNLFLLRAYLEKNEEGWEYFSPEVFVLKEGALYNNWFVFEQFVPYWLEYNTAVDKDMLAEKHKISKNYLEEFKRNELYENIDELLDLLNIGIEIGLLKKVKS